MINGLKVSLAECETESILKKLITDRIKNKKMSNNFPKLSNFIFMIISSILTSFQIYIQYFNFMCFGAYIKKFTLLNQHTGCQTEQVIFDKITNAMFYEYKIQRGQKKVLLIFGRNRFKD